ncbi:DNA replication/repair protein RecF [Caulobacter vibrioides]|uniref:DNA replication/repair protein RecF n=1 Tax=Caulobacter vibrioides TaxID=155892 RepID=UPI000BB47983|nr:DNA replication/repair protein RecF [Caulobacter vibrioides]ATC23176.1 DNA replication/repair protein RecF [Caulobacter vibrioides]AZH11386.1 DNA replication/repair protein RecF [Caulobacter vibrioides]PLR13150.1 DNA replication/repair protein RecF [Caulobacter vibrioides]
MASAALLSLTLADFRSYERARLETGGRSVYLFGANGAGKTNLLEAISLLSPGKGLRGVSLAEVGRRLPGEAAGRAWAVAAEVQSGEDAPVRIGTGVEQGGAARRTVRLEGETVPPGRLADHVRPIWLTPAQDRLFLEAASERRRFFDRLVFAGEPAHAANANGYDKAQRERMRLLVDAAETGAPADAAWLTALEARLAEFGALLAQARARTLLALQAEIDGRGDRPFPLARLGLTGEWERMALEGAPFAEIELKLAQALASARARDGAAGRALTGPHRGDLAIFHVEKDRPAAECSTGEQKALILNLVLAQAARLSRAESAPNPVILLDEVAAHLDLTRRAALADELTALKLQAFLTGTDESLFDHLKGRALGVRVGDAGLTTLEDE